MAVGNLRGNGKNSLVVITGEGICFVFDVEFDQEAYDQQQSNEKVKRQMLITLIRHQPKQQPTHHARRDSPAVFGSAPSETSVADSWGPDSPVLNTWHPKSVLK